MQAYLDLGHCTTTHATISEDSTNFDRATEVVTKPCIFQKVHTVKAHSASVNELREVESGDDAESDDVVDDDEPVQREPEQSTRQMAKVKSHASCRFERDSITLGYRTGSIPNTIYHCFNHCVGAHTAIGRGGRT